MEYKLRVERSPPPYRTYWLSSKTIKRNENNGLFHLCWFNCSYRRTSLVEWRYTRYQYPSRSVKSGFDTVSSWSVLCVYWFYAGNSYAGTILNENEKYDFVVCRSACVCGGWLSQVMHFAPNHVGVMILCKLNFWSESMDLNSSLAN